ncbi:hypothetical protein GCM10023189_29290 [Nibrella saemangeumensis]|uniref:Peptidase MA superfamily protein n=1 Tax=Nibrella saemangeumensis TaxID=1084526 RepID=A0ABP8N0L3_9BACT
METLIFTVNNLMKRIVTVFMRQNKLTRYGLPLLIVIPLAYVLLYPEILRCHLIGYSPRFVPLADTTRTIYISEGTPAPQQQQLRENVKLAHERLRRYWSPLQGRAVLIYCRTPEDYNQYCVGGEGAGCSLGTPWGTSFLVLGPDGNNIDVIAHELCHDELFARLGWLTVKRQIPQWFNEGLAMMVDYRFTPPNHSGSLDSVQRYRDFRDEWLYYTHGRQRVVKLTNLESTRDFFSGSYRQVMLAYMTAGMEVSRWLMRVGRQSIPQLTADVAEGDDFQDVYQRLEQQARSRRK